MQHTNLPAQDRLESLLCALIELKSNISVVEQQHPSLSNDLSSLCDLVIDHLNRPPDTTALESTPESNSPQEQPEISSQEAVHRENPPVSSGCPPSSELSGIPVKNRRGISSIFDRAGDYLETGLDKMGDGVIFVFEKLLSPGARKKIESPEDTI
ncbi:MAG: hypothetical protein A2Z02_02305 [Chloroflexi bacterium RBG_16_48_7]|nr:MAG: hypothetical protein A2Z02_02305 [Chloroflexi bacterium RBG_16_48_7]